MSFFDFFSYFGLIPLFVLVVAIQSVVFWIVCKSKNEKQWNKRFYQCVEVFEDSRVDSSVVWSFLNGKSSESIHPDLNHPEHGPHWDYLGPNFPKGARIYPDGTWEPK
jgi:hypothetical protein